MEVTILNRKNFQIFILNNLYRYMGDIFFLILAINISIMGLIFWLLSTLAEYFFSKSKYKWTYEYYECGFRSISDINIQLNTNFLIFGALLILYDLEFTFLVPFMLSYFEITLVGILVYIFFFSCIVASFYIDWRLSALSWHI